MVAELFGIDLTVGEKQRTIGENNPLYEIDFKRKMMKKGCRIYYMFSLMLVCLTFQRSIYRKLAI